MNVRAQIASVFHLDKCIGCHTCSIACKNLWTDRKGAEYMWWNNVETKPGTGYPTRWEDQQQYQGGWEKVGNQLRLKIGGRGGTLGRIFHNPHLPTMDDYYEPFTFKYGDLTGAPAGDDQPTARPVSMVSGKPMKIEAGPNWDDDLGGSTVYAVSDPGLGALSEAERREIFEEASGGISTGALQQGWEIVRSDNRARTEHHNAFDGVLKLSDVPWPVVPAERLDDVDGAVGDEEIEFAVEIDVGDAKDAHLGRLDDGNRLVVEVEQHCPVADLWEWLVRMRLVIGTKPGGRGLLAPQHGLDELPPQRRGAPRAEPEVVLKPPAAASARAHAHPPLRGNILPGWLRAQSHRARGGRRVSIGSLLPARGR